MWKTKYPGLHSTIRNGSMFPISLVLIFIYTLVTRFGPPAFCFWFNRFICTVKASCMVFICNFYGIYVHNVDHFYVSCWFIGARIMLKNAYILQGQFCAWKPKSGLKVKNYRFGSRKGEMNTKWRLGSRSSRDKKAPPGQPGRPKESYPLLSYLSPLQQREGLVGPGTGGR